jgi:inorganic pyrophosphatase
LASKLNDLADIDTHMPGLLEATRDWFRIYKIPAGKPANIFAENGKFFDRAFALKQIEHDHGLWSEAIKGGYDETPEKLKDLSLSHTSALEGVKKGKVDVKDALALVNAESDEFKAVAANVDEVEIATVHYVDRAKI